MLHYCNNQFLIESLTSNLVSLGHHPHPPDPVLPASLPSLSRLLADASTFAKKSVQHYHLQLALNSNLPSTPHPPSAPVYTKPRSSSSRSSASFNGSAGPRYASYPAASSVTPLQGYQILRAIERKDVMLLMEARDSSFELLVQPQGGITPLVHAMRCGEGHRDIAILLIGAISRKVNTVADLPSLHSHDRAILRAIRASLKIAITYGIMTSQTELLSSYLQVIIMSEGEKFVVESAQKLSFALRSGGSVGKPVESAEKLVGKFVEREVKNNMLAAVEDFIANAVGDIVLLGLWGIVTDTFPSETEVIPVHFFARDDRILKALQDRIEELRRSTKYNKLAKSLKRQIEITFEVLGRRNINARARVEELRARLDHN